MVVHLKCCCGAELHIEEAEKFHFPSDLMVLIGEWQKRHASCRPIPPPTQIHNHQPPLTWPSLQPSPPPQFIPTPWTGDPLPQGPIGTCEGKPPMEVKL